MRQIGARPGNRITYLREVADVVARLTRGEVVTRDREESPPRRGPARRGARGSARVPDRSTGPRALRVAAELGMGFLMPEGTGAEGVRWAREALGDELSVTIYCWLSIAEDEQRAREALLPSVRRWREWNLSPRLYELAGLPAAAELTGEHLFRVAVVGTPEQCAARLRSLHDAGADTVVLQAVGEDPLGSLARMRHGIGR